MGSEDLIDWNELDYESLQRDGALLFKLQDNSPRFLESRFLSDFYINAFQGAEEILWERVPYPNQGIAA